ncbi:MAG: HAD family hydrolase [Phycisphaerae bacterium]|nr:HAD family hydrolase [Phycisphaerae bacterium]
MTLKLAIFDVDGTLTRTSGVDDECWTRAVRLAWGVDGISTDWGSYRHSTDEGIAAEVMETHRGRRATRGDLDSLRECFAGLIEREARERPERFAPIPGAVTILSSLRGHGWIPAIATGGWRRTALLKLASAGVSIEGTAAAFADDAWPREQIVRIAASRAAGGAAAGTQGDAPNDDAASSEPVERIVYVGDGVWDVTAARAGGYGFVGVATDPRASQLRRAGAPTVLEDLAEVDRVVDALERGSRLRRVVEITR